MQPIHPSTKFLGTWRLIPSSCIYDEGSAPLQATYTLTPNAKGPEHISISINWKDPTNKPMAYEYSITTDNKPHIESFAGIQMTVQSVIEGDNLKSVSKLAKTGDLVTESTRELKEDGKKLEVVMVNHKEGKKLRIYQLYEKVE